METGIMGLRIALAPKQGQFLTQFFFTFAFSDNHDPGQ